MSFFAAAIFTWILLAGFWALPATFASLGRAQLLDGSEAGRFVRTAASAILPVAFVCFAACMLGVVRLWVKFRGNYVWLLSHLFL